MKKAWYPSSLPQGKEHLASEDELTCIAKPAARREAGNTKRMDHIARPGPGLAHWADSGTPMSAIFAPSQTTALVWPCMSARCFQEVQASLFMKLSLRRSGEGVI